MKYKDYQAPALFSGTFKALNLGKNKMKYFQGLSRMRGTLCVTFVFGAFATLQSEGAYMREY